MLKNIPIFTLGLTAVTLSACTDAISTPCPINTESVSLSTRQEVTELINDFGIGIDQSQLLEGTCIVYGQIEQDADPNQDTANIYNPNDTAGVNILGLDLTARYAKNELTNGECYEDLICYYPVDTDSITWNWEGNIEAEFVVQNFDGEKYFYLIADIIYPNGNEGNHNWSFWLANSPLHCDDNVAALNIRHELTYADFPDEWYDNHFPYGFDGYAEYTELCGWLY